MDEILKRDQNFVTVLAGVTNDADQDITMLRVDPITKRLLVKGTGGGSGSPGGADTSIQFNDSGSFNGFGTWNGTYLSLPNGQAFQGQYTNLLGSAYINPDGSAVFSNGAAVFNNTGGLTVAGFKLTDSPSNGYVLTSDASGNGTWQAAGGASYTFTDSIQNTAGTVNLVGDNAAPGNSYYYGTDSSGTKGFFVLPGAGSSPWTLDSNQNMYASNTTAPSGGAAGNFIQGTGAGTSLSGGAYNFFPMTNAGQTTTNGNDNLFIGQAAGYSNVSGSRRIVMGVNVDTVDTTSNGDLNIGNLIYANGLYDGLSGHSSTPVAAGKVGIGIVPTTSTFEVNGTSKLGGDTTVNGLLTVSNDASFAQASGKVTIGTVIGTPGHLFDVYGDMYLYGAFFDGSDNPGTSGYVLSSTGGGTAWVPQAGSVWTDASTYAYYAQSIVVGGSSSPNATLDVRGYGRFSTGAFVDGGPLYTLGATGGNTLKFGNAASAPTLGGSLPVPTDYYGDQSKMLGGPNIWFLVDDDAGNHYAFPAYSI